MAPPSLPDPLPADPLPLLVTWLAEAAQASRSATSAALATVDPDGRPSVRMVICRGFDDKAGWLVFYTDRDSRKGRALERFPRAALVFHWEALQRQVRIEGPVTDAPAEDSDRYWNTRPVDARIAAIASDQTRPIASRQALLAKVEQAAKEHGATPARPARWGGYRVWADTIELWVSQPARVHDRAVWVRRLEKAGDAFTGDVWQGTRLQP